MSRVRKNELMHQLWQMDKKRRELEETLDELRQKAEEARLHEFYHCQPIYAIFQDMHSTLAQLLHAGILGAARRH